MSRSLQLALFAVLALALRLLLRLASLAPAEAVEGADPGLSWSLLGYLGLALSLAEAGLLLAAVLVAYPALSSQRVRALPVIAAACAGLALLVTLYQGLVPPESQVPLPLSGHGLILAGLAFYLFGLQAYSENFVPGQSTAEFIGHGVDAYRAGQLVWMWAALAIQDGLRFTGDIGPDLLVPARVGVAVLYALVGWWRLEFSPRVIRIVVIAGVFVFLGGAFASRLAFDGPVSHLLVTLIGLAAAGYVAWALHDCRRNALASQAPVPQIPEDAAAPFQPGARPAPGAINSGDV